MLTREEKIEVIIHLHPCEGTSERSVREFKKSKRKILLGCSVPKDVSRLLLHCDQRSPARSVLLSLRKEVKSAKKG